MDNTLVINYADIVNFFKCCVMILAACGIGLEFTPVIKINPISKLFSFIGKTLNSSTIEQMEYIQKKNEDQFDNILNKICEIDKNQQEIRQEQIGKTIDDLRWNILDFANSCRNGQKHSREEFDHVISAHTDYELICEKNNIKNGRVEADFRFVLDIYNELLHTDGFLK